MIESDRYLIVNADDFGQSAGINRGVIAGHERGIVTSASLMVRWPAVREAVDYARAHPQLSVGVHIDLGEWAFRDGSWEQVYQVVSEHDARCMRTEIQRQVETFKDLMNTEPSHLDSHQHVHRSEPALSVVSDIARNLGIPVRHFTPCIRYVGGFYGQSNAGDPYPDGISVENLMTIISGIGPGITEVGCHPGFSEGLASMYSHQRDGEVETLCEPRVAAKVKAERIVLASFLSAPVREAVRAHLHSSGLHAESGALSDPLCSGGRS